MEISLQVQIEETVIRKTCLKVSYNEKVMSEPSKRSSTKNH